MNIVPTTRLSLASPLPRMVSVPYTMKTVPPNSDALESLKAKLDELERVVRLQFEPVPVERHGSGKPHAQTPAEATELRGGQRETSGAFMNFWARLFRDRR